MNNKNTGFAASMRAGKSSLFLATATLALAFSLESASADSITVPDFSFESGVGVTNNNTADTTTVPGWTVDSPSYYGAQPIAGQYGSNPPPGTGHTDGNQLLFLNLDNAGQVATITSTNTLALISSGTTYTLTVDLGNNNQGGGYGTPGNEFISLLGNGTLLSTTLIPDATIVNNTSVSTIPNDSTVDFSTSFTGSALTAGENLTIQIGTSAPDNNGYQAQIDNVRLDASAVPEPSTYAMLAAGLTLLCFCVHRKSFVA
jgi:hypothetical protein